MLEEVVEGTYAGNSIESEAAENGVEGCAFHHIDPLREALFRIGHEEK